MTTIKTPIGENIFNIALAKLKVIQVPTRTFNKRARNISTLDALLEDQLSFNLEFPSFHLYPDSTEHSELQPSPDIVFPSSQ